MEQLLQQLSKSQQEAVLYNEGPSLIIAGAGSGKTRVLTYKIAYLLKNGISPYNILALTFTNKAAREMKSRIAQIMGEDIARRLWMGTFHSLFSRILRRNSDKIGFRSDFTVYDSQDSRNLIKAIIKECCLDDKIYKPSTIQSHISRVKNALITPKNYTLDRNLIEMDNQLKRGRTHEIYTTYWNRCKTSEVMDFDDLLLYTYLLFDGHREILEQYRNQFRFIMVDEYQDTNQVQHAIVRLLAADHRRVCVVGDDAQSIYSFRGAYIGNILNFRETYPESKLFKLEQNYRSTQMIVNAANSLIRKNKEQIYKTVYSEKIQGEKIKVIRTYSDYEEGYNVASLITEMRMLRQYEYKDFVILYRTNAQSRIFEEALRKINIPYKIYGGLSFYQRKEIKDVIAYMRLVINPNDEEALKRIINYPARGIGDTTLNKIIAAAGIHGVSLWEILSNPQDYNLNINSGTARKLSGFKELINSFRENNTSMNVYELGGSIIETVGLLSELYEDKTPEGLSHIQNINELMNSLYTFVSSRMEEGNTNIYTGDFLAEISLLTDQDTDKENENVNYVTMMTIHSAKGLEFKNVFVVGLEENLFPSERNRDKPKEMEEERRLFYVAITRAEENVILTYAKNRFSKGEFITTNPSRFINDIDPEYLHLPSDFSFKKPNNKIFGFESDPRPNFVQPGYYTNQRKLAQIETDKSDLITHHSIGNLTVGNTVKHERFGIGKIIELSGEKENAKAVIKFEALGTKQLLLKFAKFEIVK
ncbi:MAG: UvrD-helicase domain-containing protein [Dysgonamonadaceae bacterium]|jgi:DNA helicase-2/ATP-dependent DNA helicase PcrA|nr:UvrD-helicase domain-containing protein [Dysgonamonadaceae bacterium]